ncbi:hypothetical protein J437_LFUL003504 [Ladona fulva]|uniref:Box C/D snoRNA protein 1 n=1 Tax=Ladona fulva TaxID=123851 RepID=A0A8K0NX00_LADFU|nr:hypothetical protein J437_LFUL003504 [Ladona fulva]
MTSSMDSTEILRLGNCEVCNNESAKYTCPKCEVKSCSLKCVNIHKSELNCNGERDMVAYKPLSKFTNIDLLSDYRLMETISRSVDSYQRDPKKKFTRIRRDLPHHLYVLKMAATRRGCKLNFLPQNFSRHQSNTTYLDWKKDLLYWRIEFIFPQADNFCLSIERFPEDQKVSCALANHLKSTSALQFYESAGISGMTLLQKAEGIKKSSSRYYVVDSSLSLKENLKGKFIVEFPVILVVLNDHKFMYDVVDSDEEVEENPDICFPGNIPGAISEQKSTGSEAKNLLFNDDFSSSDSEDDSRKTRKTVPKQKKLNIPAYDELIKQK